MHCPYCHTTLEQAIIATVEVDYCPRCYGLWFERDELQWAKDAKDEDLKWLDIDLWKDTSRFRISQGKKLCPQDRVPLYETRYGDSDIHVDVCNLCYGVWLDRGEFKGIMAYVADKGQKEVLFHFAKNLRNETWEVVSGPQLLTEEVEDVLILMKLLRYKFLTQHPTMARFVASLPG